MGGGADGHAFSPERCRAVDCGGSPLTTVDGFDTRKPNTGENVLRRFRGGLRLANGGENPGQPICLNPHERGPGRFPPHKHRGDEIYIQNENYLSNITEGTK